MKEDPEPGAKCRDKFLVQSVGITPERESRSLPELVRHPWLAPVRACRLMTST